MVSLKSKLLALCCTLLLTSSLAAADKCRGLALEGGGDKGSYQAGAFKGLIDTLDAAESAYDVVSGISAGSLNALALAMYGKGSESDASDFMWNIWNTVSKDAVYKNWDGGVVHGLSKEKGMYDTSPLRALVEEKLSENFQARSVHFGTTNQNDGTLVVYNNLKVTYEETVNAVMSSSSVPFIFPFQAWNGQADMDGMCKMNLNLFPIIAECRNKGYADEDIIVDAILCSAPEVLPPIDAKEYKTLKILSRLTDILSYDGSMKYTTQAKASYPKINFRYFVFPTESLPDGAIPLGFKHENMVGMYNIGVSDGQKIAKMGAGSNLSRHISDYETNQANMANGSLMKTGQKEEEQKSSLQDPNLSFTF